ncbi:MAG: cupin domain-containing protein [Devosia sp.]
MALAIFAFTAGVVQAADYPPIVVPAGEAPVIYPEGPAELLASSAQTNNTMAMMIVYDLAGSGTAVPIDQAMGIAFYVLEGSYRFTFDGQPHDVGPGGAIVLPPRQVFEYKNIGTTTGRMLFVSAPGGGDAFFLMSDDQHHISKETMAKLNAKYGLKR